MHNLASLVEDDVDQGFQGRVRIGLLRQSRPDTLRIAGESHILCIVADNSTSAVVDRLDDVSQVIDLDERVGLVSRQLHESLTWEPVSTYDKSDIVAALRDGSKQPIDFAYHFV